MKIPKTKLQIIDLALRPVGLRAVRRDSDRKRTSSILTWPVEFSAVEREFVNLVSENEWSMVSAARLFSTAKAVKNSVENSIPGDFVECGVWRGGNSILAALLLREWGSDKKVWLFDTFAGMTKPDNRDYYLVDGTRAIGHFIESQEADHNSWAFSPLEDVKARFVELGLDGYAEFVVGDVAQTLQTKKRLPSEISTLRLDTDWYASTKKELDVLFPLLSTGGVLLIDDYGSWAGSRQATDEYFAERGLKPFVQMSDFDGRVIVKMA